MKLPYIIPAFALLISSCIDERSNKKFEIISSDYSGIDFSNNITATDSFNVIDFYYIYNGGGLGIGDFNNDGLQDVYFSGNETSNKLYLNEGEFKFRDISEAAGIRAEDIWSQGVAIADINGDGWQDIYVCASIFPTQDKRSNKLYINQGLNEKGIPTFSEEAESWGIVECGHSANAAFFDYDLDGDLDLFVINNFMDRVFPSEFRPKIVDGSSVNSDKLYENNGNEFFEDVSEQAGILIEGYSHGISVRDINMDGWPDIYITNDFLPNDILYINNQDGTFSNRVSEYLRHQCFSAMGNDIADINNDGLQEIFALDMLPEINYRKKTMLLKSSPMNQINYERFDYDLQFIRNMLHLNMGPGRDGIMHFSEIGYLAGIEETDWSWSPLFADFDNDGFKDLVVANGFPGDVTDMDFATYMNKYQHYVRRRSELFDTIPEVRIDNYIFKNNGDMTFAKKTSEWGFESKNFSNSAAFADFDNDGDLDYITNNIDMPATLYKNNTMEQTGENEGVNYIRLRLKGDKKNSHGYGAKVMAYLGETQLFHEHSVFRGFMASVDPVIHFGLGARKQLDSLVVIWPGGNISKTYELEANREYELIFEESNKTQDAPHNSGSDHKLFTNPNKDIIPNFVHEEKQLFDFNYQPTLPHKLSQYTPGVAVSDVNLDGLEDFYVGGNALQAGAFFIQQGNGKFTRENRFQGEMNRIPQETGILFFDFDHDGDDDLYLVSGGIEADPGDEMYQDMLYVNDGRGYFRYDPEALPRMRHSGSCVKATDFDNDGDLDLFVGTRTTPGQYPYSDGSHILINENGIFSDQTSAICKELLEQNMITDAIWTDFDNDGAMDLIVVGEWMNIEIFHQQNGKLQNISSNALDKAYVGWWNSIAGADIDNDGDTDYLCGNLGLNSIFQGNDQFPLMIFAKDFDNNGIIDPIVVKYIHDEQFMLQPFPVSTRDGVVSQVSILKQRIETYRAFGQSTIYDLFTKDELQNSYQRSANYLESSVMLNLGNGKFKVIPLPAEAQIAPIYGIISNDFNHDGNLDILMVGNDYSLEYMSGRIDAFNGCVLIGQGIGQFVALKPHDSGFEVTGDGKALATLYTADHEALIIATQNKDSLSTHFSTSNQNTILIDPKNAQYAEITLSDGSTRKHEFYFGTSFVSQSSRKLEVPAKVREVILYKNQEVIERIEVNKE